MTDATVVLDLSKLSPAELDASLAKLDAAIRTLSNPETMFSVGAELASAQASVARMEKLNAPYTGGDDGPIREPGDTMPEGDDAAVDDIDFMAVEVLRLRKLVRQLEAEKTVARAWIAELLGGPKKAAAGLGRIELLHQEIAKLRAEHEDDCLEYDRDERAGESGE